ESPVNMYGANYAAFDPNVGNGILVDNSGDQVKFTGIEQFNITASQGDDKLLGLNQNDTLNGSKGNDSIEGNGGNDSLVGGDGGDSLIGGTGKDILNAGAGNDRLIGIKPDAAIPGQSEVDTLIGGIGSDRFILGVPNQFYYNDNNNAVLGTTDYALIVGFKASEDFLQLTGSTTNYVLKSAPTGLPSGLGIFRKTTNQNELIAVLQGVSSLSLNSSSIIFV
ncbi:MAG: calcium-binding protein, partial [Planktothrix rubescens PR222]